MAVGLCVVRQSHAAHLRITPQVLVLLKVYALIFMSSTISLDVYHYSPPGCHFIQSGVFIKFVIFRWRSLTFQRALTLNSCNALRIATMGKYMYVQAFAQW